MILFEYVDDEGYATEIELPSRKEVCHECHGTGKYVNRAIDGNGITADEMDELGEDFLQDYMSGRYDVVCEECNGANVIDVVDEERAHPLDLAKYHEYQQQEWEYQAMIEAERRMGA